jgi:hypothetical protein
MTIDAMVRAGVEPALADPGVDKVREIVKGAAGDGISVAVNSSDGFEMGGSSLSVDVVRSCACPESMSTSVSCTGMTCAASAKPYVYYRITAAKYYDPIIIPRFPLRAAIQVEVK